MAVSAQELLDSVEAALKAFADNGAIASYQIAAAGGGTRMVTRSYIPTLIEWRKQLRAEIAAASGGGGPHFNFARRGPG